MRIWKERITTQTALAGCHHRERPLAPLPDLMFILIALHPHSAVIPFAFPASLSTVFDNAKLIID